MRKEVKVLEFDAKCANCGAKLPKGSPAVVYDNGIVYDMECREDLDVVFEEVNHIISDDIKEEILVELKLLNRILRRIYHCLARRQHKPNLFE